MKVIGSNGYQGSNSLSENPVYLLAIYVIVVIILLFFFQYNWGKKGFIDYLTYLNVIYKVLSLS